MARPSGPTLALWGFIAVALLAFAIAWFATGGALEDPAPAPIETGAPGPPGRGGPPGGGFRPGPR